MGQLDDIQPIVSDKEALLQSWMPFRKYTVIDNFYPDPDSIVEWAQSLEYTVRSEGYAHFERTDPRLKYYSDTAIIGRLLWHMPGMTIDLHDWSNNHAFQSTFYRPITPIPKGAAANHRHPDYSDWTVLISLAKDLPPTFGTSLWIHKSGFERITGTYYGIPGKRLSFAEEMPAAQSECDKDWVKLDYISNRYNRAIIYSPKFIHSATYDENNAEAAKKRLSQIYTWNEDRSSHDPSTLDYDLDIPHGLPAELCSTESGEAIKNL